MVSHICLKIHRPSGLGGNSPPDTTSSLAIPVTSLYRTSASPGILGLTKGAVSGAVLRLLSRAVQFEFLHGVPLVGAADGRPMRLRMSFHFRDILSRRPPGREQETWRQPSEF